MLSKSFEKSLYLSLYIFIPVHPEVAPINGTNELTGEENGMITLSFEILRAIPSVLVEDIRWVYSRNFSETPYGQMDITNLTNRTEKSTFTFSSDLLSLTVSNIAQARRAGEQTDSGRYFLVAMNPAGRGVSYIDLLVAG